MDGLKGKNIAVGVKQSKKAVFAGEVKYLVIAEDVENGVLDDILAEASAKNIEVKKAESMQALGKSAGIDVGAAIVAVLDN